MNPAPPTTTPRTPVAPAEIRGIGLFTELDVTCVIRPAEPGQGLCFLRTDLPDAPPIPATLRSLTGRPVHPAFAQIPPRHTVLALGDAVVYTTEHVLAAMAGLGVTDATIELDGPEVPISDGSALPFTDALVAAGLREFETSHDTAPLRIDTPVTVTSPDGRASITAEPIGHDETPSYRYQLDFGPDAPIAAQTAEWQGDPRSFVADVAPARTFSLAAEAQQMQALGLFRRFSPRDLLVVDDRGHPIDNAWRGCDEPARHKLLDLIGDLALVGRPIHARVLATRAGHALNHEMAKALIAAAVG